MLVHFRMITISKLLARAEVVPESRLKRFADWKETPDHELIPSFSLRSRDRWVYHPCTTLSLRRCRRVLCSRNRTAKRQICSIFCMDSYYVGMQNGSEVRPRKWRSVADDTFLCVPCSTVSPYRLMTAAAIFSYGAPRSDSPAVSPRIVWSVRRLEEAINCV